MKKAKYFIAATLCASLLLCVFAADAGERFRLTNGRQAVIEKGRLLLIGADGTRSVAPPGQYNTREGKHSVIVREAGVEVVPNQRVER